MTKKNNITDEQVEAFKKDMQELEEKHGLRLQAIMDYRAHGIVPTISLQEVNSVE